MNIAVTGASGFLGYHLISTLLREGHNVSAIALDATTSSALKKFNIPKFDLDVRDHQAHYTLFQEMDVVYHLASVIELTNRKTESVFSINVDGTKAVAQAALDAGVKRFIYTSSIHALSRHPFHKTIDEGRALALDDAFDYDRSKAYAELALEEYRDKGLNVVIANLTGLWGPDDYIPSLMGLSLFDFMRSKYFMLSCKGGFNFVDVRDAAKTLVNMLEKGESGERYIIAGEWYSTTEILLASNRAAGLKARPITLPGRLAKAVLPLNRIYWKLMKMNELYTEQSVVHLSSHRHICDQKARNELGHESRSITDTMKDMHHWLQNERVEF